MSSAPTYPAEGAPAPAFKLPANGGQTIGLDDFKGKQNIVLYFYPRDDTPGCTREACSFRDLEREFAAAGTAILGVSADDIGSHEQFAAKFSLPFPLLADTDHAISERYGVWQLKRQADREFMGIVRTTFLIDKEGTLRKVYPQVNVEGHVDAVLQDIRSL